MQVLSNFLNNAIKFTSRGSIALGYEHIPQGLRFYVRDTGRGMAQEDVPRVFDRFTKLDAFVPGTGLGLSICEGIVRQLEGTIGVHSVVGEGSTFWFEIPCEPDCSPHRPPHTTPAVQPPATQDPSL